MADGTVGVRQSPLADRPIDNEAIAGAGGTVYRQRVQVGGSGLDSLAHVHNRAPADTDYGLVTRLALGPMADAFGRLRTSTPTNIFDAQNQYNTSPLIWGTIAVGTGAITHLPNESAVSLSVSTTSGDSIKYQTRRYHRYQPGKSLLVTMTGAFGAPKANVRKRIGYFDDDNGLFFEQTAAGISVVRRSKTTGSVVDSAVAQSSWNLDKLDGTGASGITLDSSLAQLFIIDFQWLSVGRVRFGFDFGGHVVYCHELLAANVLSGPYMTTANLPLRYELTNTATAASGTTLKAICASVVSEGGHSPLGYVHAAHSGTTGRVLTARTPLLTIRLKSTFNSLTNRGLVAAKSMTVLTNNNLLWELVYNGTLSGTPSWTSAGANAVVEYDVGASGISGGELINAGHIAGAVGSGATSIEPDISLADLVLTLDPAGTTSDTLTVVGTPLTATASTYASLQWSEEY